MLGDVFRVAVSIAMFHALARRRLWTYLGVETASAALIAILVGIGIQQNFIDAPYVGYVAAYGVLFVVIGVRFMLAPHMERRGSPRGDGSGHA
jgi:hypothetical protein